MQPVMFTTPIYSLLDGYLAPAAGVLEGQQASDGLGNQAGAESYPESQQVGAGDPTNSGELEPQLDSSAETLPRVPKTPDTSFESKPRGAGSGVGATRTSAWSKSGEREQPDLRSAGQEGDSIPSGVPLHKDAVKPTSPRSELHPEGWDKRQPVAMEPSSGEKGIVS